MSPSIVLDVAALFPLNANIRRSFISVASVPLAE